MMASYLYYKLDISLLSDTEYDQLAYILLRDYDLFEHQHKYLVTKDMLKAGTAYSIYKYPLMVMGACETYLKDNHDHRRTY